jgi:3-mercaptopyruvate sulfurtransferase SseA
MRGRVMKSDDEWVNLVKGILRAEMARRGMTYEQLAEKLAEIGVKDSAVNIRNKVARGGFSAVFFVQCLRAMGCQTVRLERE